jgi:hypothetical protein
MEPRKKYDPLFDPFKPDGTETPEQYFKKSFEFTTKFYLEEYERIRNTKFDELTPEFFFKEYIWVVHATGFSASAVGKFMPRLLEAYGDYRSLSSQTFEQSFPRVSIVCNNPQKSRAVHSTSVLMKREIDSIGWQSYRDQSLSTTDKLAGLPYIGKVTCNHLARNIGILDKVKPDLHLVRMADFWGFADSEAMISEMSKAYCIPLGLADLCVWYYASTFGTQGFKLGDVR